MATSGRHHFAPLGKENAESGTVKLQGIVFDMDGTLCEPQNYMFSKMRSKVGIPESSDILKHIRALPEPERTSAIANIEEIELEAMGKQVPQPGLIHLMEFLDKHKIRKGICTRNFDKPVAHLLKNHIPGHRFEPVVTRKFEPPKPLPAGILHIAKAWGVYDGEVDVKTRVEPPLPIVMVGDSVDDMAAGREAGALTVLLRSEGKGDLAEDERTDVVIDTLDKLVKLLEDGLRPSR